MPEIIGIKKDEKTNSYILLVSIEGQTNPIEIVMTKDFVDQIIANEVPNEEKSLNEALKKIQQIRMERVLYIEKIDKELANLVQEAEQKLSSAQDKIEVFKYASLMKTKLSIITQRRHLSKLAAHEEAELRVKLLKLQRGE
jgi:hypothetical protein